MTLEERVAELERRMTALERPRKADEHSEPTGEHKFWALKQLTKDLQKREATNGGVVYAGTITLPTGEQYEWQQGALAEGLLETDWEQAAEPLAALGHQVRLRLLREILIGRSTVSALTEIKDVGTTGQIYHHLRQLTNAGWLRTAARGRYEVPAGRIVPLLVILSAAGL
ncbi:MAG: winged helix-turn-helix transcriptional regulator [Corynebacteriales bacterium]|nr:winged helix-turn-helix transcriptional regulator [Mycobacteriales bacterium]